MHRWVLPTSLTHYYVSMHACIKAEASNDRSCRPRRLHCRVLQCAHFYSVRPRARRRLPIRRAACRFFVKKSPCFPAILIGLAHTFFSEKSPCFLNFLNFAVRPTYSPKKITVHPPFYCNMYMKYVSIFYGRILRFTLLSTVICR